jgi:hypothetical protein
VERGESDGRDAERDSRGQSGVGCRSIVYPTDETASDGDTPAPPIPERDSVLGDLSERPALLGLAPYRIVNARTDRLAVAVDRPTRVGDVAAVVIVGDQRREARRCRDGILVGVGSVADAV